MQRYFFLLLSVLMNSGMVAAHPVSHTDAWVTVSDVVEVRLKVFLDDVVRHQLKTAGTRLAADQVETAIRLHSATLLKQLSIFQLGIPLKGRVTSLPSWHPENSIVDLEADANLKLTWDLQFELTGPAVRTLCFVHEFTLAGLTKPGELRLNLRRKGAENRVSATIPPGRPFTAVLPGEDFNRESSGASVNTNDAVSRLIVAPSAVIHEFTAPLLLMDYAWPAAEQLRDPAAGDGDSAAPVFLNEADVETAKMELSDWFLGNVYVLADNQRLDAVGVDVEFFPDGIDRGTFESEMPLRSGTPLYGTTVGIRVRYPPQRRAGSLEVMFAQRPGLFEMATVEKVDRAGQSSELIEFAKMSADGQFESVLQYNWLSTALPTSHQSTGLVSPASELLASELISVDKIRPGFAGVVVGLLFFVIAVGTLIGKRRRIGTASRIYLLCISATAASAIVWLLPDSKSSIDTERADLVVQGLLTGVYYAIADSKSDEGVGRLSEYLEDDLVEDVYLTTVRNMMSSETGEVFIDLESVSIDALSVRSCDVRDRLETECTWRVRGTVHHWGHAHQRELVSTGQIDLFRDDERWKIQAVSLTETSRISALDENRENS